MGNEVDLLMVDDWVSLLLSKVLLISLCQMALWVSLTGASCARWLEDGTTKFLVCLADRPLSDERVKALENRIILLVWQVVEM